MVGIVGKSTVAGGEYAHQETVVGITGDDARLGGVDRGGVVHQGGVGVFGQEAHPTGSLVGMTMAA